MTYWVRPLNGPITQYFNNPVNHHPGTDYAAPMGVPIVSASAGVVSYAGPASGFGDHAVSIWHPADGVTTTYGHMEAHYVGTGQQVQAGQVIGLCDTQGFSTGPHLHFEVRPGQATFGGIPPNIDSDAWLHDHGAYGQTPALQPAGQLTATDRANIRTMQGILHVQVDGAWGKQTDNALQTLRWHNLNQNSKNTVVAQLQQLWKLTPDGDWGPLTDKDYLMLRYCYLNK